MFNCLLTIVRLQLLDKTLNLLSIFARGYQHRIGHCHNDDIVKPNDRR